MGPLRGVRILELAGLGPGPFAGMVLADLGADVLRVARPNYPEPETGAILHRGRPTIHLDLKTDAGVLEALRLITLGDALIDPFRPGVTERLGIGPADAMSANSNLIYARMTGWGQTGPLSDSAGHDINYLALTGALAAIGRADSPPPPPLNLVADFGGGGMFLALAIAAALFERTASGNGGQAIDVSMVDGVSLLLASTLARRQAGAWTDERAANLLDGGAPFYDTYETADGRFMAVGALESSFYGALLNRLGLSVDEFPQHDRTRWPALREALTALFGQHTQREWVQALDGIDACCTPVLTLDEAAAHPHNTARRVFQRIEGTLHPSPGPRFSRTPAGVRGKADLRAVLAAWQLDPE